MTVSVPGSSAMPYASFWSVSSSFGFGMRRMPVTSRLFTVVKAPPESFTRTNRSCVV